MRIIGGKLKGKKLLYIKNSITRPLRDLVKENIFNIIQHSKLVNIEINKSNVLDLYSGTGSFGIECLSRGASNVIFIENDKNAIKILKKNIEDLSLKKKTDLFNLDIKKFIFNSNINFNLIFLDTPFNDNNYVETLKQIKELKIYKKKHLIILHRESKKNEFFDSSLKMLLVKKYGRSEIFFAEFN